MKPPLLPKKEQGWFFVFDGKIHSFFYRYDNSIVEPSRELGLESYILLCTSTKQRWNHLGRTVPIFFVKGVIPFTRYFQKLGCKISLSRNRKSFSAAWTLGPLQPINCRRSPVIPTFNTVPYNRIPSPFCKFVEGKGAFFINIKFKF